MRRSIPFLVCAAVLMGCVTTPSRPVAARVVLLPSKQLRISGVSAEERATSVLVRGRVARRSMMPGPVWGHLHVEAWGSQGLLTWKDTRWSQLSKRRLPTSFFSTTLAAAPSQIQEIRVSHVTAAHSGRAPQELNDD